MFLAIHRQILKILHNIYNKKVQVLMADKDIETNLVFIKNISMKIYYFYNKYKYKFYNSPKISGLSLADAIGLVNNTKT